PLLIVGTAKEQPVRLLETRLVGKNHELLDTDEGIVFLTQKPGKTFSPTLLVTGSTQRAVLRGVRKLIAGKFEGASTFVRVSQDEIMAPVPPRKWKGFLPANNHFTLGELGVKEVRLDSQNGFSAALPLLATPDTRFIDYGQQMTLA